MTARRADNGAEWAAFADGQWSRVDHTGTPIDLFDPDRPHEEVTSMHEPGPDGASHSALDALMWGSGDPSALA